MYSYTYNKYILNINEKSFEKKKKRKKKNKIDI